MGTIQCEKRDAVWVLTIDNPKKRNAFSGNMVKALLDRLNEAETARSVRCVVITGAGDIAFSSGHDLDEMLSQDRSAISDDEANAGLILPASLGKPTIAAVNGHAYAAGFILALSCDLRVVSENATFCASGARIGLLPVGGQISRLPHMIPYTKALEMLMTSAPVTAAEAHALGFANRLVPAGEALPEALKLATTIAGNSPKVVREIKRGVEISLRAGSQAASEFEHTMSPKIKAGPDSEEGIRAFLEKRRPNFRDG